MEMNREKKYVSSVVGKQIGEIRNKVEMGVGTDYFIYTFCHCSLSTINYTVDLISAIHRFIISSLP